MWDRIIATHSEVILNATEPTRVLGFFGQSPRPLVDEDQRNQLREALKLLAAQMRPDEIHPEVVEKLNRVAALGAE